MNLRMETTSAGVNWGEVCDIFEQVDLQCGSVENVQKAFENSQIVRFVYDGDKLIAIGRALTDFISQSSIYDVAVSPDYQKGGIGRQLVESLMQECDGTNILMCVYPGCEVFYKKFGFRLLKTGMARFRKPNWMSIRGFTE
ncbi:GNAT family N-acetyltransferase [Synergistaceae bacterium OttesenSCG-928-D05]|nr:GNAT family N-acetyltransferase [Synergistaceae bacterium OttesenSCG-928-D05]